MNTAYFANSLGVPGASSTGSNIIICPAGELLVIGNLVRSSASFLSPTFSRLKFLLHSGTNRRTSEAMPSNVSDAVCPVPRKYDAEKLNRIFLYVWM